MKLLQELTSRSWPRRLGIFVFGALLVLTLKSGLAQEALRVSLTGQEAAEARRRAVAAPGYYNLKVGNWRLRLSSAFGVEYNDNVNLEDTAVGSGTNRIANPPDSDFILRPSFDIASSLPVSRRNTLDIGIGVGYAYYLNNSDLNRLYVNPLSGVSFDIFVGDWLINLHNRLTVTEESAASVSVSGTGNYGYFENVAGITGIWDINRLVTELSYDFRIRISTTSEFKHQNSSQHLFRIGESLKLNSVSSVGLEASVGLISYEQNDFGGGMQYSAGLFYRRQVGRHFVLRAGAGYFIYFLDNNGTNQPVGGGIAQFQDQVDGMYGMLGVTHRLNPRFAYRLDVGRQFQVDIFAENLELYYVRLATDLNLFRRMPMSAYFSFESGVQSSGLLEHTDRLGGGFSVMRMLTRNLSTSLAYNIYARSSDLPGRNYLQNRVTLTMNYRF